MKVVASKSEQVPISKIRAGNAFQWEGDCYIRPSTVICNKHGIGGINLRDGSWISNSATLRVKPVEMEVHKL